MKALLIDPVARTVTEVDYSGDFQGRNGAYEHIQCNMVEQVFDDRLGHSVVWADEEGLFKGGQHGWRFMGGLYDGIVGRGLIAGVDDEEQKYIVPEAHPFAKRIELAPNEESLLQVFIRMGDSYSHPSWNYKTWRDVEKYKEAAAKALPWIRLGFLIAKRMYGSSEIMVNLIRTIIDEVAIDHDDYKRPAGGSTLKVEAVFNEPNQSIILTREDSVARVFPVHQRVEPSVASV